MIVFSEPANSALMTEVTPDTQLIRDLSEFLNKKPSRIASEIGAVHEQGGKPMPENRNAPGGGDRDRKARALDCRVINHLHLMMDEEADGGEGEATRHFDTVRGMFTEGEAIYPGAAFRSQSHVQIAVRSPECIKGVFHPPELDDVQALFIDLDE